MDFRKTISLAILLAPGAFRCAGADPSDPPPEPVVIDKRVFGVLPNYRSADGTATFEPITTRQKYVIGLRDSTDKPVYLLGAFYGGIAQLQNSNPSLGQGMKGFGQRYIRSLADGSLGNLMTEGVMPSLLHEDPRYFLQGPNGKSVSQRVWYALTRVVVTKTDSGGARFNYSEFLGNAGAVAISNLYYAESRTALDNLGKFGIQVGTDAVSNVLKEFWPDVKRKYFHRKHSTS